MPETILKGKGKQLVTGDLPYDYKNRVQNSIVQYIKGDVEKLGIEARNNTPPNYTTYPEFNNSIRIYGYNHVVRKYCGWPDSLPLPISWTHSYLPEGSGYNDFQLSPLPHWWINGKRENEWIIERGLIAPAFLHKLGHPGLYLPEQENIPERKGTIVFPNHSTWRNFPSNMREYLGGLKGLPDKFHPFTVCLMMGDADYQGLYIKETFGFDIVTLGAHGPTFIEYHREVMSKFEYATSDYPGFASVYGVHWGCKYFHSLTPAIFYDVLSDHYIVAEQYVDTWTRDEKLFSLENVENDLEKKEEVVDEYLGRLFKKEPNELRKILFELTKEVTYRVIWGFSKLVSSGDLDNTVMKVESSEDPCYGFEEFKEFY